MSNKPRPSLQRRETRSTAEERRKILDQGLRVTVDGTVYEVRMGDLSGIHAKMLRAELGLSFIGLMEALRKDPDLDLIAGVVWLRKLVDGHPVPFESIASTLGYDQVDELFESLQPIEDPEDLTDPEDPEAIHPEG